jgi:hypothetical protein
LLINERLALAPLFWLSALTSQYYFSGREVAHLLDKYLLKYVVTISEILEWVLNL